MQYYKTTQSFPKYYDLTQMHGYNPGQKWNIQLGHAGYKLLLRLILERNEFKGRIYERDEGVLQVRTVMWLGYCD